MSYNSEPASLIGVWRALEKDVRSKEVYGDATMQFDEMGTLTYIVEQGEVTQHITLKYRIDGDYLVTDQPSAPGEEETKFLLDEGTLWLEHDGITSRWTRISD